MQSKSRKVVHTVNLFVYRAEEGRMEAELRGAAGADWQRGEADGLRAELNK